MVLGELEFGNQPAEFVVRVRIGEIAVEVVVFVVAEVGVERDDAEARVRGCTVGAVVAADLQACGRGEPGAPLG